jgi:hypothetical protein
MMTTTGPETPKKHLVETGLDSVLQSSSLEIRGPKRYGISKSTVGCKVGNAKMPAAWIKVAFETKGGAKIASFGASGEIEAQKIQGITKPKLLRATRWEDEKYNWFAMLFEHQTGFVSRTIHLKEDPKLGPAFFPALSKAINAMQSLSTERCAIQADDIVSRLKTAFNIDATGLIQFVPAHGDLHWGNVASKPFTIIDWSSWGLHPFGMDVARLWLTATHVPKLRKQIEETFASTIRDPRFGLAVLWNGLQILSIACQVEPYATELKPVLEKEMITMLERVKSGNWP